MTNNPPAQQQKFSEYHSEDEISLVDLWLVLVKHWVLIVVVAIVCVVIGLLYALNKPALYEYRGSIEIGNIVKKSELNGPEQVLIEQPGVLLGKLNENYIPLVMRDYLSNHPDVRNVLDVQAQLLKNSQIINLSSKGAKEDAEIHLGLHQAVVDKVQESHKKTFALLTQEAATQKQQRKASLDGLEDELKHIQDRQKRLAELSAFLSRQSEQTRIDLRHARENREQLNREIKDSSRAASILFMLDGEIFRQSERVRDIEERLKIELPDSRDSLNRELADNLRAQKILQDTFAKYDGLLANLLKTRMLTPTTRSKRPVGIQIEQIIGLSLMLGLMLGVFAAFFAEFLRKARAQLRQAATYTQLN